MILDSERAAVGCTLRNQEWAEELAQELQENDFYDDRSRNVFRAVKALVDEGLTVNSVSVADRTGISRLDVEELSNSAEGINTNKLVTLVNDLRRVSDLRSTFHACREAESCITSDAKLEDVLEAIESGIYRIDRNGTNEPQDGSDVLQAVITSFLERHKLGGGPEVSTGLRDLDRAIIGLRPGKQMVIAGRPSMGKTALADTIRRAVVAQGYGAITFSLEMSAEELLERELAYQAEMNLRKVIAAKEVTEDELRRVIASGGSLIPGRWAIDDRSYSIVGMRRRARIIAGRMARQGIKVGCIVLDYIQLAGDNGDGREQAVSAISRGCKLMAKELQCSVLALSQLNRGCESRDDRRPLLSDLRESGSIEQDADVVGFVYREHLYNNEVPPEEAEFIVRKQRSGPTGTVRLKYIPKTCTFVDKEATVNTKEIGQA